MRKSNSGGVFTNGEPSKDDIQDILDGGQPYAMVGEICTPPVKLTVDGVEYDAFNEDHTLADIIRYAISQVDYDEVRCIVETMGESDKCRST